jgi:hypothetical protein
MVHELEILGDPIESWKVTAKYLCIVPKWFTLLPFQLSPYLISQPCQLNKLLAA